MIDHELQDTVRQVQLDIEDRLDSPLREEDSPCLFIQVSSYYSYILSRVDYGQECLTPIQKSAEHSGRVMQAKVVISLTSVM